MWHLQRGSCRRTLWPVWALLCLLAGCTWSNQEPGLFGRVTSPTAAQSPSSSPVASPPSWRVNSDLPVVGENVGTSTDGLGIQVRIAVHAVRRIPGGTVLDWSVTPLGTPELTPGDAVPPTVDLGLTRWGEDDLNVFLVDGPGRRVYRPLTLDRSQQPSCLCPSLRDVQRHLRIGETQLMQIGYPQLPRDLAAVDVDVATLPMFFHVPVTAVGMVPQATSPVALGRPAEPQSIVASTRSFRHPPSGQSFVISVDEVIAGSTFTSVHWTIQSLTDGPGLQLATGPPFAAAGAAAELANPISATGPQVVLRGRRAAQLSVRQTTFRQHGRAGRECLCTDLRVWSSVLRRAHRRASVVTNLPPLPIGAVQVDVVFPGLATLPELRVASASDGAVRSARPRRGSGRTYRPGRPPARWTVDQWPTPVPSSSQLSRYRATVDRLVS